MRTFETVIERSGHTRTRAGRRVTAEFDPEEYLLGRATTNAEREALSLHRNEFHGDCVHDKIKNLIYDTLQATPVTSPGRSPNQASRRRGRIHIGRAVSLVIR